MFIEHLYWRSDLPRRTVTLNLIRNGWIDFWFYSYIYFSRIWQKQFKALYFDIPFESSLHALLQSVHECNANYLTVRLNTNITQTCKNKFVMLQFFAKRSSQVITVHDYEPLTRGQIPNRFFVLHLESY